MRAHDLLLIVLLTSTTACAVQPDASDESDADAGKEDSAAALPFFTTTGARTKNFAGTPARAFKLTTQIQHVIESIDDRATVGGYFGAAFSVSPAALTSALADHEQMWNLVGIGAHYFERGRFVTGGPVDPLERGALFASLYEHEVASGALDEWSAQDVTAAKADLRALVRSMLAAPNARAFYWSGSVQDDWGTDGWFSADPTTGIVKIVINDQQI